jgi:2-C-methyl-D-erythritol 4-phosphate cytidylyltransferase
MKKFVLIVAGGSGKRMNSNTPKQFIPLSGKPILMHTINLFYNFDTTIEIILVLPESQIKGWKKLCDIYNFKLNHKICTGGSERFYSVKNGLAQTTGNGIVFIHDGVRPLVSNDTLARCYNDALKKGNAIPVVPVPESVRIVDKEKNSSVDRSKLFLVQTPQTFRLTEIKQAYNQDYSLKFTDDASVLETTGKTINLVNGNRENIKITFPADIEWAKAIFLSRKARP